MSIGGGSLTRKDSDDETSLKEFVTFFIQLVCMLTLVVIVFLLVPLLICLVLPLAVLILSFVIFSILFFKEFRKIFVNYSNLKAEGYFIIVFILFISLALKFVFFCHLIR